jgi:cytochrome c oxidase cbb3-type subunit I/II
MVRPIHSETQRYGEYSKPGEFVYDHPFLWGSRRIGPDLHRVGGKYPNLWHVRHFENPAAVTPNSIMPRYPWLLRDRVDFPSISPRLRALHAVGVPYDASTIAGADALAREQARTIAADVKAQGGPSGLEDKQVVALIAYLQRLGTDIKLAPPPGAPEAPAPPAVASRGATAP